jgi:hypothetical protein
LDIRKKLALGLAAYAGLGLLAWNTLSNDPVPVFNTEIRLRSVTLIVLGLFAFRTLLHYWRVRIEEADAKRQAK